MKRTTAISSAFFISSIWLCGPVVAQDNAPIPFDSPTIIQEQPSSPTPSNDASNENSSDNDVQSVSNLTQILDQAPDNVIHGAETGFITAAAALIAAELLSAGTVTIPLAVAILSSGTFIGAMSGTSQNITDLGTVLDSVSGDLDQ